MTYTSWFVEGNLRLYDLPFDDVLGPNARHSIHSHRGGSPLCVLFSIDLSVWRHVQEASEGVLAMTSWA